MVPCTDATADSNAVTPTRILLDTGEDGDESTTGGGGDKNSDETSGADEDPCAKATTCKDCESATSVLTEDNEVCDWALGKSEALECIKKSKSEVGDILRDMCSSSGSDSEGTIIPAGEPTATEDDEGNGTLLAIVLLLVFVGIAYSNRNKMMNVLKAADGFDGIGGGGETGGSPKPVKYHDV